MTEIALRNIPYNVLRDTISEILNIEEGVYTEIGISKETLLNYIDNIDKSIFAATGKMESLAYSLDIIRKKDDVDLLFDAIESKIIFSKFYSMNIVILKLIKQLYIALLKRNSQIITLVYKKTKENIYELQEYLEKCIDKYLDILPKKMFDQEQYRMYCELTKHYFDYLTSVDEIIDNNFRYTIN